MKVVLHPTVAKTIKKMHEPDQGRIKNALKKLENNPPSGDIKSLSGRDGYRLRVGNYRLCFDIVDHQMIIFSLDQRGQIYKNRR